MKPCYTYQPLLLLSQIRPPPPPTPLILGATPTAIIFLPLYSMCSTLSERLERHVGPGYTVLLIPQIYP